MERSDTRDLRALISEALRSSDAQLLTEARELPPKELTALTRYLSLKFQKSPSGSWHAEARISEKKSAEQASFKRNWSKMMAALRKKPWSPVSARHDGWNGQTDTGGNFSSNESQFQHQSGLRVRAESSVSFRTGTRTWSIAAWITEPQQTRRAGSARTG